MSWSSSSGEAAIDSVSPAAAVAPPSVTAKDREPRVYRHDTTRGRRYVNPCKKGPCHISTDFYWRNNPLSQKYNISAISWSKCNLANLQIPHLVGWHKNITIKPKSKDKTIVNNWQKKLSLLLYNTYIYLYIYVYLAL